MNAPTSFNFTTSSGIRRAIKPIDRDDLGSYHLLGRAVGVDFGHAFFEGTLHCPDFEDRVAGFRALEEGDAVEADDEELVRAARHCREVTGYDYVAVAFYEWRS